MARIVVVAVLVACSSKSGSAPTPMVRADDAGAARVTVVLDPHGDGDVVHRPALQPPATRQGRPIDVTLRSTPPNAQVSVDGIAVGTTPTYWGGEADGREHEFTFVLPRYAIARYRFVPITNGVIHARLEPITDEPDAGLPPPPELVPVLVTPAAPPTAVGPVEAAPTLDATTSPGLGPPR